MNDAPIELDAHRPHFVIACSCGVHVVPELYLQRLAAGDPAVEPLPECLLRSVVAGWLDMMGEHTVPPVPLCDPPGPRII